MVSRDTHNVWIADYMMASRKHGTVYTGVTSQLPGRTSLHRDGVMRGFTRRHGVYRLVWYETHETMSTAIQREKIIKKYKRDWKINLIEADNPDWNDLFPNLFGATDPELWPEVERIRSR